MIFILLPAYNEAPDLPVLLDEIGGAKIPGIYSIVVVDDGSNDGTGDSLRAYEKKLPLSVLRHAVNQGLGKALSTGFAHIAGVIADRDILITMDADRSHPVALIGDLVRGITDGKDVVVASRYVRGARQTGVPVFRRLLSRGAGTLMRLTRPIKGVTDYTSGYRAFSGRIVRALAASYGSDLFTESSFAATLEILLKAAELKATFGEVALPLRYDLKTGASKMRVMHTIARYALLFCRLLRRRF